MTDLDLKLRAMNLAAARAFSDPPSGDAQSVRHTLSIVSAPFRECGFDSRDRVKRRVNFNRVEPRRVVSKIVRGLHAARIERAGPACGRKGGSAQTDFSSHPEMPSCRTLSNLDHQERINELARLHAMTHCRIFLVKRSSCWSSFQPAT